MFTSNYNLYCLFVLLLLRSTLTLSQVIEIEWEMTYGGHGDDRGTAIIQSADSGYVVVGYTNSIDGDITSPLGYQDFWITKLDSIGNLEWQKSYGGSSSEFCNDICQGINGGYLLVGQSQSIDGDLTENKGNYDFWAVKIDDEGAIEWQKTFGGMLSENANAVIQTNDGNYMLTGYTLSNDGDITFNHGSADIWAIKINESGEIIWQKTFGSSDSESAQDIIETASGDFYIVGDSDGWDGDVVGNNGYSDYWILKINGVGDILWGKTYGGSDGDIPKAVALKENGIICVGQTYSEDEDVVGFHGLLDTWAVAVDSMGNFQWQRPYGGTGGDEAYGIAKLSDNDFVFSGRSSTVNGDVTENKGGVDFWIVSIDSLGNINWQKSIGGSDNENSYDVINTIDSQLLITGYSASIDFDVSSETPGNNFWVVKLKKCETIYYFDNDSDGFGNLLIDSVACSMPMGYAINSLDCNDGNNLINPGAIEICNSLDDNCNFISDEDLIFTTYYFDGDEDNYGNLDEDTLWCAPVAGYVMDGTDCNDTNPDIYPGATETLNGIDDDCDQTADEGLSIIENELVDLTINPNPTISDITLQFNILSSPTLTIYQITGEIVYFVDNVISPYTFNTISFAPGVYFINLQDENVAAQGVFIKN